MASRETIELEVSGGAARIVLNRPDSLNSWNEQFGRELLDVVREVSADDAVRAVMITGAGRAFSSGADLKEQRSGERRPARPEPAAEGDLPPDHPRHPRDAEAGDRRRQRARGRDRLLARARLRPGARRRVRLLPARLRQHRPRPRRRLDRDAAGPDRLRAHRRDGDAGRARPGRAGAGVGDRQPRPRRRDLADRGRERCCEHLADGPTKVLRQLQAADQPPGVRAASPSQLEAEADAQREQGQTADFVEGVLAFAEKRAAEVHRDS